MRKVTVFEANNAIEKAMAPDQYAMYLRKSRVDLELEAISKEETLARHKQMLFTLAERHGVSPSQITIYHEMVSGDSIDERPEMQRLLDDVHKGLYVGVFVVEIERLARGNTKDQGEDTNDTADDQKRKILIHFAVPPLLPTFAGLPFSCIPGWYRKAVGGCPGRQLCRRL